MNSTNHRTGERVKDSLCVVAVVLGINLIAHGAVRHSGWLTSIGGFLCAWFLITIVQSLRASRRP